MSKDTFKTVAFRDQTRDMIAQCNQVINTYLAQGLRLTLRQLYYQLVVRNIVTNMERSYQNLSRIISDGRLAGLVDWDAIEDRIRVPRLPFIWRSGPAAYLRASIGGYRLDRWEDQSYYVELWVEKDALAGVLEPIATGRDVTMMVNRGYSSQSAMHDAYERFMDASLDGKECVLLYLGDLDPSGEDMVRDISDRLNEVFGTPVDVRKIAITPAQVAQYNPPPNPAKMSDSRANGFVKKHGYESYEVDALPPNVLTQVINDAIDSLIDQDAYDAVVTQEDEHRKRMQDAADGLDGVSP